MPLMRVWTRSARTVTPPLELSRTPRRERIDQLHRRRATDILGIDERKLSVLDLHGDRRLLRDAAVGRELDLAVERLHVLLVEFGHQALALLLAQRRRQAERLDRLLLGDEPARCRRLNVVRRVAVLLLDHLVELRGR